MGRSRLWMLCLAGGMFAAGCTDYGSYHVRWRFTGEDAGEGAPLPRCGQHGVGSVRVIGASSEGEREDVVALCTAGELTHSVPVGSWTFAVHQLDARGRLVDPVDADGAQFAPSAAAVIAEDATVDLEPVTVELAPRPECSDGVDNDCDGRVDLDDPECEGDPGGTVEAAIGAPGC